MAISTTINNSFQSSAFAIRQQWLAYLANIGGLALAFAFFILAMGYVSYQTHFDQWVPNYQNKYQIVNQHFKKATGESLSSNFTYGVHGLDKARYPDVLSHTYLEKAFTTSLISHGREHEVRPVRALASLFTFFGLEVIEGHTGQVDGKIPSILLSKSISQQVFGNTSPIDQVVALKRNTHKVRVVGVFEDLRSDTHIRFDVVELMSEIEQTKSKYYSPHYSLSYIELAKGAEPEVIRYALAQEEKSTFEKKSKNAGLTTDIKMIPLQQLQRRMQGKRLQYLLVGLTVLSFLLFGVALFNYACFMTVSATRRLKEIAVRKTFGINRRSILAPYTLEALCCLLAALGVGAVIAVVLFNQFQYLLDANFNLKEALDSGLKYWLVMTVFVSITVSLLLPAYAAIKIRPAQLFGGIHHQEGKISALIPLYVISQIIISVSITCVVIGAFLQFKYQSNSKLGFNSHNVLTIQPSNGIYKVRKRLESLPETVSFSFSSKAPILRPFNSSPIYNIGEIESNFLSLYQVKLLAGDTLKESDYTQALAHFKETAKNRKNALDTSGNRTDADNLKLHYGASTTFNILVSKSAVQELDFSTPEEAIGYIIPGSHFNTVDEHSYRIVGVIPDLYHDWKIGEKPSPEFYVAAPNLASRSVFVQCVSLRWKGTSRQEYEQTVREISSEAGRISNMFEYVWLDDLIEKKIQPERSRMILLAALAFVVILIAAIGLHFAVSAQTQRMRREMSIRKVFGSSNLSILARVYLTYAKPVLIANLLAWPIAYLVLQRWLAQYNDRIDISPWMFLSATGLSLLVMVLVVTKEAIRQAYSKPVDDLVKGEE